MVDQLPYPPRDSILVKVSFVAILVGDEEKLFVLVLVLSFGQVDLKSSDQTKQANPPNVQSGKDSWNNQLLQRSSPFSAKLSLRDEPG